MNGSSTLGAPKKREEIGQPLSRLEAGESQYKAVAGVKSSRVEKLVVAVLGLVAAHRSKCKPD